MLKKPEHIYAKLGKGIPYEYNGQTYQVYYLSSPDSLSSGMYDSDVKEELLHLSLIHI